MRRTFRVWAALLMAVLLANGGSAGEAPKLEKVVLNIEGMKCPRCVQDIQSVLLKVSGVEKAEVSLEENEAIVQFKRGKVTSDQLIKAVEGASNPMFQYGASVVPEGVTLKVEGMTCPRCVKTIRSALLKMGGVHTAEVSLKKGEAYVRFDPTMTAANELIEAIKGASNPMFQYKASVASEKVALDIEGMTCSACVTRVRSALLGVPGVGAVEVSLEDGKAAVEFEKGKVKPAQLIEAVGKVGYKVSVAEK